MDVNDPAKGERTRLKHGAYPGAAPGLFPWNTDSLGERRLGVRECRDRLESMDKNTVNVDVNTKLCIVQLVVK